MTENELRSWLDRFEEIVNEAEQHEELQMVAGILNVLCGAIAVLGRGNDGPLRSLLRTSMQIAEEETAQAATAVN